MPSLTAPCMTVDESLWGNDLTYSVARSTANSRMSADQGWPDRIFVGQRYYGGYYGIFRGYLKFDLTSIDPSAVISRANLKMVCISDSSVVDFNVEILKYDWSAQDPLTTTNMDTAYDNCLSAPIDVVWRNTSGMSTGVQYTSPDLDVSWVVPGGYTYYSLRSNREYAGTAPTGYNYEVILIASQEHTTVSYRPVLTVEYVLCGRTMSGYFWD